MLVLAEIFKVYNQGEANEVIALRGVSLSITRGEMVCIQGPSGSGKTTLLSIIGCILPPTRGRATIGGKKITRLPDHFLTDYRRQLIGFVFQDFNMLDHLSVLDNVTLPLMPLGISPKVRAKRGDALLERLAISHRRDFPLRQLSGGELQRAAIARALINDPPIIIADEPTAHLDSKLSGEVMDILANLKNEGRTLVVASHDPIVAGHGGIDRTVLVRDGNIVPSQGSVVK
ncbi:MAG: ABC transporter ATP-binding protein [Proteobacteria bacterium]|nr:ABC transporter ATP-binding protein [Pseudomonadota bacterium]